MLDSSSSAPKSRTRKTSSTGLWPCLRGFFSVRDLSLEESFVEPGFIYAFINKSNMSCGSYLIRQLRRQISGRGGAKVDEDRSSSGEAEYETPRLEVNIAISNSLIFLHSRIPNATAFVTEIMVFIR